MCTVWKKVRVEEGESREPFLTWSQEVDSKDWSIWLVWGSLRFDSQIYLTLPHALLRCPSGCQQCWSRDIPGHLGVTHSEALGTARGTQLSSQVGKKSYFFFFNFGSSISALSPISLIPNIFLKLSLVEGGEILQGYKALHCMHKIMIISLVPCGSQSTAIILPKHRLGVALSTTRFGPRDLNF